MYSEKRKIKCGKLWIDKRKKSEKKIKMMQGFRNYSIEAIQRDQLHVVDFPPQYGKSTPPQSPQSGKLKIFAACR